LGVECEGLGGSFSEAIDTV